MVYLVHRMCHDMTKSQDNTQGNKLSSVSIIIDDKKSLLFCVPFSFFHPASVHPSSRVNRAEKTGRSYQLFQFQPRVYSNHSGHLMRLGQNEQSSEQDA